MATNKQAVIRYHALDRCFRNPGKKYFMSDLVDVCSKALYEFSGKQEGITSRQIFEDLRFMESEQGYNIPLGRYPDGRKVYYRYTDLSYSLNNQPLNAAEQDQLKEAILTLARFKGMPQFEWVDEMTARLESELGLAKSAEKVIEFEQNAFLRGLEHFTPLYNAILYKNAIQVHYHSFTHDAAATFLFHPWFLKQYNNRWFVFGQKDNTEYIANLAMDRIIEVSETDQAYVPNSKVDFEDYFEDIIGVTVMDGVPIETVELQVDNTLYKYIQTKPIHGSQRLLKRNETNTIIAIKIIPNYELESVLLSHGERIEVLRPEWLRNRIFKKIVEMYNKYVTVNGVK